MVDSGSALPFSSFKDEPAMNSSSANPDAIRVLFVAFEAGRWGPCRLPQPLTDAGLRVAALCPADNALAHTRFVERQFPLADTQSSTRFERRLAEVLDDWRPALILPADERAVICLQTLARAAAGGKSKWLTQQHAALLLASLGRPAMYDAALMKTDTLRLAHSLGVRSPQSRTVATLTQALEAGRDFGYPVHLKTSFSWAGMGVIACRDPQELEAAARALFRKRPWDGLKNVLKTWLHRDWYPTNTAIDVQKTILGVGGAFNAVALNGRLLAGFATCKSRIAYEGGPSTVVQLCANEEMADAAATMIEALGATGFLSFDFMVEYGTAKAYLIECNPRPAQVGHLGQAIGVDLCQALAAALEGKIEPPRLIPSGERTVGLFPLAWLRDSVASEALGDALDRPKEDPTLLRFMVDKGPALAASAG